MGIDIQKHMPKEFILQEIEANLKLVRYAFGKSGVQIHFDGGEMNKKDFPRNFYTFFTLSRLWKNGLGNVDKLEIGNIMQKVFDEMQLQNSSEGLWFVCGYGLRACENFKNAELKKKLLEVFKGLDFKDLYKSFVAMYVFMSTYHEVEEVRQDKFLESVYFTCLKVFEVQFYKVGVKYPPFYFSEFSYFPKSTPAYLWEDVQKYVKDNFNNIYLTGNLASSGIAKTMEHFANVGDVEGFNLGLKFLEQRKYKYIFGFKNTNLPNVECIYTEYSNSLYVMLDTNLHLLNAYINFYEKNN